MRNQFTGFKEGDVVAVTGYGGGDKILQGTLHNFTDGLDEDVNNDLIQVDLLFEDGTYELLESGPDALSVFEFTSIDWVIG